MSNRIPEQPTLPLPAAHASRLQEATTLRMPALRTPTNGAGWLARQTLIKVPEITLLFWVIKLLTTAFGESISDYLVHRLDPVKAVMLGAVGFAIALTAQLVVRRFIPGVYWLAVVMVAVFGTMSADVVHIVLHVPYIVSSISFALALAVIFFAWYRTEHTLSIHSIDSTRRELFYWATVIATFALGTAAGDTTAYTFNLGFLTSGIVFLALFAIPALGYFLLRLNAIVAFWAAYILTRPIGASFADWTGKPTSAGGIGIGAGKVSIILAVVIIVLVGYVTVRRSAMQGASPTP